MGEIVQGTGLWRRKIEAVAVLTVLVLLPAVLVAQQTVVGVVRDGAGPSDRLLEALPEELQRHLPEATEVRLLSRSDFDGDWRGDRARAALVAALEDPDVDIVLTLGALTTAAAADPELVLSKPVVSATVSFPQLLESLDGRDRKTNLSVTVGSRSPERDIEAFRSLVSFDRLHLLVGAEIVSLLGDQNQWITELESLGGAVELVAVDADVNASLSRLGADTQAVYLAWLPRFSPDERRSLLGGLEERGLPSFSLRGHPDVELGALAGLTPDLFQQGLRRIALNLSRVVQGEAPEDLPRTLTADSRLLVNARTAVSIGYHPDEETRILAQFLHPEMLREGEELLTLAEALRLAEAGNTNLAIRDSQVAVVEQEEGIARSSILPQLGLDVEHLRSDSDLVISGVGVGTNGSTRGGLTLQQMIYDDRVVSGYRSAKRITEAARQGRESIRLEVLSDAGGALLTLGLSQSQYRIELDNLRLTEDFLELARLREEVGYSGRDEVYFWEAALATSRSNLFRSLQNVEASRIELNQILGLEQDRRWRTEEAQVDSEVFPLAGGRLDAAFDDPDIRDDLREALIEIGLENSPERLAILEVQAAQGYDVASARRSFFLPRFFLGADYFDEIWEGDNSSAIDGLSADRYRLTLGLSYDLFAGGRKSKEVGRAEAEVQALQYELALTSELVERRVRTSFRAVENSFPRVRFAAQATEAALSNLEIVRDKYAEGVVNVTDLQSAQNQAFAAEQLATAAQFELLIDLLELQRALGWLEPEKSEPEKDDFAAAVDSRARSQ